MQLGTRALGVACIAIPFRGVACTPPSATPSATPNSMHPLITPLPYSFRAFFPLAVSAPVGGKCPPLLSWVMVIKPSVTNRCNP